MQAMQPMTVDELVYMTSSELMRVLDQLRAAAADVGCEWAELNKEFRDLKELVPSRLAELRIEFEDKGAKPARAKLLAEQSAAYQMRILDCNEMERKMRLKEVEYKGLMRSMEALTSIAYVRNNELKLAR